MEWEDKKQIHVTSAQGLSFILNITPVTPDYLGGASSCSLEVFYQWWCGPHWRSTISVKELLCLKKEDIPEDKMLTFLLTNLCT